MSELLLDQEQEISLETYATEHENFKKIVNANNIGKSVRETNVIEPLTKAEVDKRFEAIVDGIDANFDKTPMEISAKGRKTGLGDDAGWSWK